MKNQNGKPVIFLAFANDHQSYLYKLTEEQDGIRSALENAEREGLCEVVYETDTDVDKIFRVFDKYQDRIAVFHYGGHAEDYTLLLKAADGSRQYANSDGLTAFLAAQKGLQLVFINGCCSKQQAEKLRSLGVPAVVGTAQPIDDAAATILSTQFYESLAAGRTIAQSWQAAEAKVKTRTDAAVGYRAVWPGHAKKNEGRISFPWELYICPGAEKVEDWNLPRASKNPLFGLPLPKKYYANLPPAPFLGLNYFQEDDAALFFGRGAQIRALHSHIDGVHPIILFYGKSGVGKSSLLYAGLLPRIKDQFNVVYCRRNQELGLLGTLKKELGADVPNEEKISEKIDQRQESLRLLGEWKTQLPDKVIAEQVEKMLGQLKDAPSTQPLAAVDGLPEILKQWQAIEAGEGKPLIVILDQVEEHYTRPMDEGEGVDELGEFLDAIQPLFGSAAGAIQGKLILSYRKEYHPEIRDTFQDKKLPYAEVFLKRLDREGVVEAITGVTKDANIQAKYRLEISPNPAGSLPETLAEDLLADQESPIAPVLQIILKKLWESANEKNEDAPRFTSEQYQQLKKDGISMGEFFEQQMALLAADMPKAVSSGLALDLLKHHTTDLGTAGRCSQPQLETYYSKRLPTIKKLINKCIEHSLLLRIDKNNTVLAHDILAPVVIREFNISDRPGQKAMRVLANRSHGWKDGNTGELLDRQDMVVLAAGAEGRRDLDSDEERMLAASEKAQLQRRRQLQRRIAIAAVGPMLIAAFAWLIFQYNNAFVGLAKPAYEWSKEEIQFTRGEPFSSIVTTGFYSEDLRSQKIRSDIGATLNVGFGERNNWSILAGYLQPVESGIVLAKTGETAIAIDSLLNLHVKLNDYTNSSPDEDRDRILNFIGQMGAGNDGLDTILIKKLEDEDPNIRWGAAEALGEIGRGNSKTVAALIGKLAESGVRSAAARALGEIGAGDSSAFTALLKEVQADDPKGMLYIDALGNVGAGNPEAIDLLISKLDVNQHVSVRHRAAHALGKIAVGNEKAINALIRKVYGGGSRTAHTSANALGKMAAGNEKAIIALTSALSGGNYYVRVSAAEALGNVGGGNADAITALIEAIDDDSSNVRKEVTRALGKIAVGDSAAIAALINKYNAEDPAEISEAIVEGLGNIATGKKLEIEALTEIADSHYRWTVCRAAAEGLGKIAVQNGETIQFLMEVVNRRSSPRGSLDKSLAIQTLGTIAVGNTDVSSLLIGKLEFLNDISNRSKRTYYGKLTETIGKIAVGDTGAIAMLISKLSNENEEIRRKAVEALGEIGAENDRAIAALLERLDDPEGSVRRASAVALGKTAAGNTNAVNALIREFADSDANIRREVAEALGVIAVGNDAVIKQFTVAMKDSHDDVDGAVNVILPKLLQEKPVDELLEMLEHPEYGYRYGAAGALARKKILDPSLIEALASLKQDSRPWVRMAAWDANYFIQKRKLQEAQVDALLKKAADSMENENFQMAEIDFRNAYQLLINIVFVDSAKIGKALLQQANCRVAYGYPYDLERLLNEALRFQPALKNSEEYSAIREAMENIKK